MLGSMMCCTFINYFLFRIIALSWILILIRTSNESTSMDIIIVQLVGFIKVIHRLIVVWKDVNHSASGIFSFYLRFFCDFWLFNNSFSSSSSSDSYKCLKLDRSSFSVTTSTGSFSKMTFSLIPFILKILRLPLSLSWLNSPCKIF